MGFPLQASLARGLIGDPVKALKVNLGADLDDFQAARFRHWWFCEEVMDHSGVSTGKSEMAFFFVFLRLMLLPLAAPRKARIVSVYYQSQGTAEEVFLPKVEEYAGKSNFFYGQIKLQHGRKLWSTHKNVIVIRMKEGGWCELPAGDFMKDSQGQASKRVNDIIIDEGAMIDQLGRGLNKQILQRNTRECFNPNHCVHANHTIFLGHAESPEHIYARRYFAFRRAWRRKGSQTHCVITSSYKDYRGEYAKRFGQDVARKARQQLGTDLDEAEHAQIYDGLWKRGSKGLYSETLRDGLLRADMGVHMRRQDPETVYYLGWDTAQGLSSKLDWNVGVVTAATPVVASPGGPGYMLIEGSSWLVRGVFAVFLPPGADVDQKAGLIHLLHSRFGFAGMTLDNLGGGIEVYMKLRESRQFINNEWVQTSGLCAPKEAFVWPLAQPLVSFYERGEQLFAPWFGEKYVADNTGPIDFAHREMRGLMRKGEIAWPRGPSRREPAAMATMSHEELTALGALEKVLGQFGNIGVKVDKNGLPMVSEKGFQKFVNSGKKDGAMAALYSVLGLRATLAQRVAGAARSNSGASMGVFA